MNIRKVKKALKKIDNQSFVFIKNHNGKFCAKNEYITIFIVCFKKSILVQEYDIDSEGFEYLEKEYSTKVVNGKIELPKLK